MNRHFAHIFRPTSRNPRNVTLGPPRPVAIAATIIQLAIACAIGAAIGILFALAIINH